MNTHSFLELRLFENGIDFINKSMESFVLAAEEKKTIEYKYAILLLATGAEIILKSILEDIHPLFIKENLDSTTDKTVKAENLVNRINKIYSHTDSKKRIHKLDEDNLTSIREIRNNIIHKEVKFENETATQKIYANTLFSLDRIVKDFKNHTLSTSVTNWAYIVNIDPIQEAYYNTAKGISYDGLAVPCSFCSIKKLVKKNNSIECLHCGNKFGTIMEAINSLEDIDLIEDLFKAFSVEMYRKGMHFMDCPHCLEEDYAWFDTEKKVGLCFKCGPINTTECYKCKENSMITYHHEINGQQEEVEYCFTCNDYPNSKSCPNCYEDLYQLREPIRIDVKDSYQFYPQVALKPPSHSVFIEVSLCPKCYNKMEKFEEKGLIEIL